MERLAGMDASFLHLENSTLPLHVVGVLVLDASEVEGQGYERLRDMLEERLHLMPPFRKRLVEVPFQLDHPRWIRDPDFDLDQHIHRVAAPEPHDLTALAGMAGKIAGDPLRRDRPLWEMWIVEGLEGDRVGVITKMHHATIDGVTGTDLMVHLFDFDPEPREVEPPDEPFEGEQPPSDWRLVADGVGRQLLQPVGVARTAWKTARQGMQLAGNVLFSDSGATAPRPFSAPRIPMSRPLTPHRTVAFAQAGLDDVKRIKNAFDGKVNDVILAVSSIALRDYLAAHDVLPDRPLLANCPVSMHDDAVDVTNAISTMLVKLPVTEPDPAAQLEQIIAETRGAKEFANAIGAEALMDWAEFTAPRLLNAASRMYASLRLGALHRPLHNLIVSNVPGPPMPLYVAGCRVDAIYPMGPLLPGAGLNITALSNMNNVDFGILACQELVPDVADLAAGIEKAVGVLLARAEERAGTGSRS